MHKVFPKKRLRLWFSVYSLMPYSGQGEPDFYPESDFPWAAAFAENLPLIKQELETYLRDRSLNIHYGTSIVSRRGAWSSIPLVTWGLYYHRQLALFPATSSALRKIDGLVSASFSVLQAGSSIYPHFGDTNAIFRAHMGVIVPAGLPEVGFRVNGQERAWKEGEFLFFCDGYVHSAWNHSESDRIVIIIDVLRPEFLHLRRFVCATVLAALSLQLLVSKIRPLGWLLLMPFYAVEAVLSVSAYLVSPIYNVLSKLFARK